MRFASPAAPLAAAALILAVGCGDTATEPSESSGLAPIARTASIVNGTGVSEAAFAADWPFAAALLAGGMPFCSASVVANRWVLTAAHCAEELGRLEQYGLPVAVGVGASALSSMRYIPVAAVHIHESYSSALFANDIALIELAADAAVEPARLSESPPASGAVVDVAGWGLTSGGESALLRQTTLTVFGSDGDVFWAAGQFSNGICFGDSGGPAVADGLLVGINSFILTACGAESAHTTVSAFLPWIESTSGVGSPSPEMALAKLVADAAALPRLSAGTMKKLTGAQAALAAGQLPPVCSKLAEFIDDIASHGGKRLTLEAAEDLIGQATAIRAMLAC